MRECHNTSMHLRACSSVLSATEKDASKITREREGQRERGSEKQRMKQGKGKKSGGEGAGAAQEQKHPREPSEQAKPVQRQMRQIVHGRRRTAEGSEGLCAIISDRTCSTERLTTNWAQTVRFSLLITCTCSQHISNTSATHQQHISNTSATH